MSIQYLFKFAMRVRNALLTRWWQLLGPVWLKIQGISFHNPPTLYGYPIIAMHPNSTITLEDAVVLCSDSRFTALGVSHPVILRTLRPYASISIGKDSGLSGVTICAAQSVSIGANCLIGADVQIFDTDFHTLAAKNRRHESDPALIGTAAVCIADNVFIGTGSKIMKGVTIGCNSVIGAGSIVSKNIPANSIAVGNPAKVIAELTP